MVEKRRELYPYQQSFVNDESRFRQVLKSRQIGFSTLIALEMASSALRGGMGKWHLKDGDFLALCVSASERQAQEVLKKCYKVLRQYGSKITFVKETESSFTLLNGASVYSLPNNPVTVQGFAANHIYLDEFAIMAGDKTMFEALIPSISRGGRLTMVSTPYGKRGEFYKSWTEGEDDDILRLKMGDEFKWSGRPLIPVDGGGFILPSRTPEEVSKYMLPYPVCPDLDIEPIRKKIDDLSFRQSYCCEFVDETQAFFPYDLIVSAIEAGLVNVSKYEGKYPVYVGVDFGKMVDSSVIIAVEMSYPARVLLIQEYQGTEFERQFEYLEAIVKRMKATKVSVDATGYGVPLLEQAQKKLGHIVEGVTFTNPLKEKMATGLRVAFEDGSLKIPQNAVLIEQLHGLERSLTDAGNVRYKHQSGKHDDYVWALALAYQPSIPPLERSTTVGIGMIEGDEEEEIHVGRALEF